jgi:3-keto-5-aminohexanoate cleavage enzyme
MAKTFTGEARKPGAARDPDVAVVTCALTGVLANRKQCPAIPYTPAEIGEEARRAHEAGAAVVHIHARNDDGSPTFSPAVFASIKAEIQKRCPVILNFSTGTILEDVTEQCAYIRESKPEIAALNMGTMNYSKYSAKRKAFDFDMVFPNTYGKIMSKTNSFRFSEYFE